MFTKSIRWRMQLWLAFLLICILSGFGFTAYQLQRINRLKQMDEELDRRVTALKNDILGMPLFGPPPGRPELSNMDPMQMLPPRRPAMSPDSRDRDRRGPGPGSRGGRRDEFFDQREIRLSLRTTSLLEQAESNVFYYYTIWSRHGTLLKSSTNAPPDLMIPNRRSTDAPRYVRTRDAFREAVYFTEIGECILVGRSMAADLIAMHRFAFLLLTAGGAILALGLGGGWLIAGRAMHPIEAISAAASRISAGNLSERINMADTDSELGRLAGVLNTTFTRLEAAFDQQKQFTADASHELRTPITVIMSEAQTALARERTAEEYRETIQSCLETAQQMRRLAQSLLELARYDSGQIPLEHAKLDLASQTEECIELVQPLAAQRGIQIRTSLMPAPVQGDAVRLGQAITNLLVNAIHYNKQNGEINVETRSDADSVQLSIIDTGQGIAATDIPHIFKRFYRADKSRTHNSDRNGLGLAICKAIVDSHGGRIEVASELGVGSTFIIRLPIG